MDAWYATKDLMMVMDGMGKTFYCPLKVNRSMDDSGAQCPYRRVDSLEWSEQELELGKLEKADGSPGDYKLKLLRVVVSTHRTEWIVTNDLSEDSLRAAQNGHRLRWKVEELYRGGKQLAGIGGNLGYILAYLLVRWSHRAPMPGKIRPKYKSRMRVRENFWARENPPGRTSPDGPTTRFYRLSRGVPTASVLRSCP